MNRAAVALVLVSISLPARAEFAAPVPAPVDRLIKNIERQLQGQPNSADLNYRRGRLYALKAVQREAHIFGDDESNFRILSRNERVLEAGATEPAKAALKTSIASYRAAIKANPDWAAVHLGLAWALEAGAKVKLDGAAMKEALAEYRRAFELSSATDAKRTEQPFSMGGLNDLVSWEAGGAWLRAAPAAGEDAAFRKSVETHLAKLKALPPPSKITPVLFSRSGRRSLAQLEDKQSCSTFDLDGTRRGTCWSWLDRDAALLVWDPEGKGEVKNGWQLFGSVSFFLFFRHGYEALAALDDDGDGWLSGEELPGIAAWSDLNSDGHPQPDEVQSLESLGVARISARGVKKQGVWQQPRGLEFKDGSTRASWDWVSKPMQPSAPASPGAQP